jgi:hypothetical protein
MNYPDVGHVSEIDTIRRNWTYGLDGLSLD